MYSEAGHLPVSEEKGEATASLGEMLTSQGSRFEPKRGPSPISSCHLEMCNCHFNSDSGHSNPAPPEDKDTPWFGESSPPTPVRNVTPNEDTDNLRPIVGPGTSANGHPALSGTWGQVFCCQPRAVDQQPPLKTAAPRGLPWKGGPLA